MKLFEYIEGGSLHIKAGQKRIPQNEVSQLMDAATAKERIFEECQRYRKQVEEECVELKKTAKQEGFQEGLKQWSEQLMQFKKEIERIENEINETLAPLALTAVKKIIGKELEVNPELILDIVKTALKPVSQHRKITIFVNKEDISRIEDNRPEIKKVFEHLETLAIKSRDDIKTGGCIIETEAGIINAQLESQLSALETAFQTFFLNRKKEEPKNEPKEEISDSKNDENEDTEDSDFEEHSEESEESEEESS